MNLSKKTFLFFVIYLLSSSIFFFYINLNDIKTKKFTLFFQDTNISYKITDLLAMDPNNGNILLTRAFHNKITLSLDSFLTSVGQSTDPVFIFSLSKDSPLYYGPTDIKMLFPFELPLFLIALIYITKKWNYKKDKYFYSFIFLGMSIFTTGLLASFQPLKLLPLTIALRTIIFIGIFDLLIKEKWLKKYFS